MSFLIYWLALLAGTFVKFLFSHSIQHPRFVIVLSALSLSVSVPAKPNERTLILCIQLLDL